MASSSPFNLLIVGASTRAAAFSAIRAGFRPRCLDLFADLDLQARAQVERVPDYPQGLIERLLSIPSMPMIYVGGLENHPEILSTARQHHTLWGNDETVLELVRDPQLLSECLRISRLPQLETRSEAEPPPADGQWLIRPRSGSGGKGIAVWDESAASCATLQEPHCYQQRIEGKSYSATFISPVDVGDVRFVGMTQQLIGEAACHAAGFQWCGNIAPISLTMEAEHLLRRLANVLKWKTKIQGLFGIDFIVDEQGTPWITEVNPRYPASVELLEHVTGIPLLSEHCRVFESANLPIARWGNVHQQSFVGKAILFSPAEFQLSRELADPRQVPVDQLPVTADLPEQGQPFQKGDPVCTLYASGASSDEVWSTLQQRLQAATAYLGIQ